MSEGDEDVAISDARSDCSKGSWQTGSYWDDTYLQMVQQSGTSSAQAAHICTLQSSDMRVGFADTPHSNVNEPLAQIHKPTLSAKELLWQAAHVGGDAGLATSTAPHAWRNSPALCPLSPEAAGTKCLDRSQAPSQSAWSSRAPVLAWCDGRDQESVRKGIQGYLESEGCTPVVDMHFGTSPEFTRWLFLQPRGAIEPWAVLLVGWREAKPCAMAISAARSGDISKLRPDSRCPELQTITRNPCGEVQVAVKHMIIRVQSNSDQERRARRWARKEACSLLGKICIHVASDDHGLVRIASSLISSLPVSVGAVAESTIVSL